MRRPVKQQQQQNSSDFIQIGGEKNFINAPPLRKSAMALKVAVGSGVVASSSSSTSTSTSSAPTAATELALKKAIQTGNLNIANKNLKYLPWLQLFPSENEDDDDDDGITAKVTNHNPMNSMNQSPDRTERKAGSLHHLHSSAGNFGRKRFAQIDNTIDFARDSKNSNNNGNNNNEIKPWEGHPIQSIDCSANQISNLIFCDGTENDFIRFSKLSQFLKSLQCSRNELTSLPPFHGFASLVSLDLSRNKNLEGDLVLQICGTTQIAEQAACSNSSLLPSLAELDASHNNFTRAVGICDVIAKNLRVLRLSHNKLERVGFLLNNNNNNVFVSSLREVDISYNNNLIDSPFTSSSSSSASAQQVENNNSNNICHPCIEMLDMSFCGFNLSSDTNLKIGKQQFNNNFGNEKQQQSQVFHQHFSTLRLLSLRHSGLSSLQVSCCPQLREINCSENQLLHFPQIDTSSRSQLAAIDVSNNKLKVMDAIVNDPTDSGKIVIGADNVAALYPSLERLDVSNNDIGTVPARLCLLPKLRVISLIGNPLRSIRRDLLSKNCQELKAYLRSRLVDETENDESTVTTSKAAKLQAAMEQVVVSHQQQQNQSQSQVDDAAAQQEEEQQQQQQSQQVVPIGNRLGTCWDLSKTVLSGSHHHHQHQSTARSSVVRRGGGAFTFASSASSHSNNAASHASTENDSIPLLPEFLTASIILDVSPHTREFVRDCNKLNLSGQTRIQTISLDFFHCFFSSSSSTTHSSSNNLQELEMKNCSSLKDLETILGSLEGPTKLKSLTCTNCHNLPSNFPVTWCRPLPGEQQCLQHLDLSNCNFISFPEELGLANCWSLKHLNLSFNKISQFPAQVISHLRMLTELLLASNQMKSDQLLDDLAKYLPHLTLLDLSMNILTDIRKIPNSLGTFNPNTLRALKLSGNGIRWLSTQLVEQGQTTVLLAALKEKIQGF